MVYTLYFLGYHLEILPRHYLFYCDQNKPYFHLDRYKSANQRNFSKNQGKEITIKVLHTFSKVNKYSSVTQVFINI